MKTHNLIKPITVLALSMSFMACGPELPQQEGGRSAQLENLVGGIRVYDPSETMSEQEARGILQACQALERKKAQFGTLDDLRKKLQYTSAFKNCGEEEPQTETPYFVKLKTVNGRYAYQAETVVPPFTYVVTHEDDMMGKVCGHVQSAATEGALPARAMAMAGDPVWISAYGENSPKCLDDANCVYLETGAATSSGGNRFRMRDVQFFAVNVEADSLTRGFVLERMQMNLCGDSNEETASREMTFITVVD